MSDPQGKLLIVDDDNDILVAGKLLLRRNFSEILTCDNPADINQLLASHEFDVILLDMNFSPGESSGEQGLQWLRHILDRDSEAVVILITAHGGVDLAVDAIKQGATDFISKPWQNEKVIATVSAGVKLRRSLRERNRLVEANRGLAQINETSRQPMLGNSAAMRNVKSLIERSAPTDANVLILGENGTGKELVARALHAQSTRVDRVFVSVDLGAVTESLFESELFGHRKGAFTGAHSDRVGRFKAADGGTLFLDEIGNIPLHLQAKLLTVLEQRTVTPVGSDRPEPIDVRVIAATNLSRDVLNDDKRFRTDLLFRLNTVEIALPALRDRRDDIDPLLQHYLEIYAEKYGVAVPVVSEDARQALLNYEWPGNIRALRHTVERALILANGPTLEATDFQLRGTSQPPPVTVDEEAQSDLNLARLEHKAIEEALRKHQFNISKASKELGLTRAALYRRMEKYGI